MGNVVAASFADTPTGTRNPQSASTQVFVGVDPNTDTESFAVARA